MEVILIRHGQTGGNVAMRHQSNDTRLTELGQEQARLAAKRMAKYHPTHLVTSHLVRAVQTAEVIGRECGLIPEVSTLYAELGRPARIEGHHLVSAWSLWYYFNWYLGTGKRLLADGESYEDLRRRMKAAWTALESYPADAKIVLVSHTIFINFFLAHQYRRGAIGPIGMLLAVRAAFRLRNTGEIRLIFAKNDSEKVGKWQIVNSPLETS